MRSILTLTLNITVSRSQNPTLNALDSNHNSNHNVLDYNPNSKSSISTLSLTLNALDSNPKGNADPNSKPTPYTKNALYSNPNPNSNHNLQFYET